MRGAGRVRVAALGHRYSANPALSLRAAAHLRIAALRSLPPAGVVRGLREGRLLGGLVVDGLPVRPSRLYGCRGPVVGI